MPAVCSLTAGGAALGGRVYVVDAHGAVAPGCGHQAPERPRRSSGARGQVVHQRRVEHLPQPAAPGQAGMSGMQSCLGLGLGPLTLPCMHRPQHLSLYQCTVQAATQRLLGAEQFATCSHGPAPVAALPRACAPPGPASSAICHARRGRPAAKSQRTSAPSRPPLSSSQARCGRNATAAQMLACAPRSVLYVSCARRSNT